MDGFFRFLIFSDDQKIKQQRVRRPLVTNASVEPEPSRQALSIHEKPCTHGPPLPASPSVQRAGPMRSPSVREQAATTQPQNPRPPNARQPLMPRSPRPAPMSTPQMVVRPPKGSKKPRIPD